ncbi:MAG: insulinase family protein [Lewinellaceae bacterium]|nr:insulinase family protein [Lewinellaceae bacterium]
MADVLLNPTFPEEELAKAKTRTESALASNKDDANAIAGDVASVLRYGKDHPYGEVMTEATLGKITLEQIKNHYQTYLKPNISYLVIVGDISKADAMAKAEKYFGKWAAGDVPKHQYATPKAPEKRKWILFINPEQYSRSLILLIRLCCNRKVRMLFRAA